MVSANIYNKVDRVTYSERSLVEFLARRAVIDQLRITILLSQREACTVMTFCISSRVMS